MTYSIGEVSRMYHMPPSTLRFYEQEGILTNVTKDERGQRVYTQEHLNRLGTICCFKETGMTIAQLKSFFIYEEDEESHIDEMIQLLQERKESVSEQIEVLSRDYEHVLRKLYFYSEVRSSIQKGEKRPDWDQYRDKTFPEKNFRI